MKTGNFTASLMSWKEKTSNACKRKIMLQASVSKIHGLWWDFLKHYSTLLLRWRHIWIIWIIRCLFFINNCRINRWLWNSCWIRRTRNVYILWSWLWNNRGWSNYMYHTRYLYFSINCSLMTSAIPWTAITA